MTSVSPSPSARQRKHAVVEAKSAVDSSARKRILGTPSQSLTVEDFIAKYELPNRPVILENSLKQWPAYTGRDGRSWSREYMLEMAGSSKFNSGGVAFSLAPPS